MAGRLRLLITALVVGSAVLVMHVDALAAPDPSHAAVDHHDHALCGADCPAEPGHGGQALMVCSMALLAVGAAALVVVATRGRSFRTRAPAASRGRPRRVLVTSAPFRPPDRAALAVMRC